MVRSEEEYYKKFGSQNELRERFKQPYLKAVVPYVAAALKLRLGNAPREVKILVIGGGDGRFSRDVLPVLKSIFKKSQPDFKVVESDLTFAVKRAKNAYARVVANAKEMPFADNSFDLIVGESMIHQLEVDGIGQAIEKIKNILKPHGTFIHVQDFSPDPNYWSSARLSNSRFSATNSFNDQNVATLFSAMGREAHQNLVLCLNASAQRNGLHFNSIPIEGSSVVDSSLVTAIQGQAVKRFNRISFDFGDVLGSEIKLPKGKTELVYRGMVTLTSKHPAVLNIERHMGQFKK